MNREEWLVTLSRANDITKAPAMPFTVRLGKVPFTFSTDRIVVAVSTRDKLWPPPPPKDAEAIPPYQAYKNIVEAVKKAQQCQREVGVIDALLLKEMAGEPNWIPEHVEELWDEAHPVFKINETCYSQPVLARALASWTEPIALVGQASFLDRDPPHDDVLILTCEDLALFCSPYVRSKNSSSAIIEMPEGMFVPAKK